MFLFLQFFLCRRIVIWKNWLSTYCKSTNFTVDKIVCWWIICWQIVCRRIICWDFASQ
jgi:hypothetical protein